MLSITSLSFSTFLCSWEPDHVEIKKIDFKFVEGNVELLAPLESAPIKIHAVVDGFKKTYANGDDLPWYVNGQFAK